MSTDAAPQPPSRLKRILVAFDASDQARFALTTAVSIAADSGARLTLVHVFVAPAFFGPAYRLVDSNTRAEILRTEQSRLEAAKATVPASISVDTLMRDGDPAAEILRAAADIHADLIAIGTHGRGRIAHAFLGSVASAVIRGAVCPVLTASHDPADQPTPTA